MIRQYLPSDVESVLEIYTSSFPPEFTPNLILRRLTSCETWVYDTGGVVGYLILDQERGKSYLSQVAVDKDFRHGGIATELIQHVEAVLYSRGKRLWWLQVEFNNPAQKLYFDLGFRVSGFEENIYGFGKHSIEMTKVLQ